MHSLEKPILAVENLPLDRSGRRILQDITLTLCRGEFLGVIGPNGGGKTTLLRVLLGVISPSRGSARWFAGESGRPRIGYVPQRGGLDGNFPVSSREVVQQGAGGRLPFFGRRWALIQSKVDQLLERVGLTSQADIPFVYLSGGQQRRLLVARA